MKNLSSKIFILVCLLICILPSCGLFIFSSGSATKEEKMTIPAFKTEEGKVNKSYFSELGDYFAKSFALRTQFIDTDAKIQGDVFKVSNNDGVIKGEDGWLYYASSVDDYLGENTLSERGIYNVVNNLNLLQEYVEGRGAEFYFTVAPNKNSLYGENMPDYAQKKTGAKNNFALLQEEIEKTKDVNYIDLYNTFKQQPEILYLKRDSHWNNKGAVLAYNTILNKMGINHDSMETTKAVREKNYVGDLSDMLYPESSANNDAYLEWNYDYQYEDNVKYTGGSDDLTESWLTTENKKGDHSLLMFRDSFGNTLIPLLSNVFGKGYYSKAANYNIEELMDQYQPEYVLAEKVERNIREYGVSPSVMSAPERELDEHVTIKDGKSEIAVEFEESYTDDAYYEVRGECECKCLEVDSDIYIGITQNGTTKYYEAFTLTTESGSDRGFLMYLKKNQITEDEVVIDVLVKNGDSFTKIASEKHGL
ncbi:MAG: hypothetical protein MJ087_02160 [Lachnospiraceae bacterium]|nr:hypothetical protein [Lachnospiraceae bacterium]